MARCHRSLSPLLDDTPIANITGQGHTGVLYREKKMSPGKVCKSCVLRSISIYTHTVYNDYYLYFQIIIEVAQLRQHKQRLNDLRTQLG